IAERAGDRDCPIRGTAGEGTYANRDPDDKAASLLEKPLADEPPALVRQSGWSMPGAVGAPACLEQEPGTFLGVVDEHLQQARCRHILMVIRKLVSLAHVFDRRLVVRHEFAQHIAW